MMLNMDLSIPAGSRPAPSVTTVFAFVSWDGAGHQRACPLATFGCPRDAPLALTARLVCVDPPRADSAELSNARDVAGAIALVVRGGCSFADKARRVQAAGAVAMVLANNTREESDAAFTMTEEQPPHGVAPIAIPCVMMCLLDVRELFRKYPPTVPPGLMTLEVLGRDEAQAIAAESLRIRQELKRTFEEQQLRGGGGGWGIGSALKRKTTALMKLMEPQPAPSNGQLFASAESERQSTTATAETRLVSTVPPLAVPEKQLSTAEIARDDKSLGTAQPSEEKLAPLVAFVQWATSADTYYLEFAPLADFCRVHDGTVFDGAPVLCDPVLADTDRIVNAAALQGNIALVKRGACTFPAKLERLQACGVIAAIVGNDDLSDPDAAFVMSVDSIPTDHITIPAVMVSSATFQQLTTDKPARVRVLSVAAGPAAADLLTRSGSTSLVGSDYLDPEALCDAEMRSDEREEPCGADNAPREFDNGVRTLHSACRAGDYDACIRLIARLCGNDEGLVRKLVSARDSYWRCGLHHACAGGNQRIVELLLQHGASPFDVDLAAQTALHVASAHARTACVELLLQAASSSIRVEDEDDRRARLIPPDIGGSTPIHLATIAGSADTLEGLLTASAQVAEDGAYKFEGVNERNADGATPLHLACRHVRADCAVYLLAASADVNATDSGGNSPLAISCEMMNECGDDSATDSLFIIEKLLTAGATMDEALTPLSSESAFFDINNADEASAERSTTNGLLLLDRIDSPVVKRDVEILYLRHEARFLRSAVRELQQDKHILSERVSFLDKSIAHLQQRNKTQESATDKKHSKFTCQIDQLQCQMSSILQLLRVNSGTSQMIGGNCSDRSLVAAVSDSLFASSPEKLFAETLRGIGEDTERAETTSSARDDSREDGVGPNPSSPHALSSHHTVSQQELALDAGLARDLGKKLLRQGQFNLAEAYFARSLEILPLPGVAELRSKARAAQNDHCRLAETLAVDVISSTAVSCDRAGSTWVTHESPLSPTTKQATIDRLIAAVVASGAPEPVRVSLEREVKKLNGIPGGSNEYELACKWLQWLTTLPWGDTTSGLTSAASGWGPASRAHSTFDTFLELERLEREHEGRSKDRAARSIQRITRQWIARCAPSANCTDAAAATRIQRCFRCWHLRRIASINRERLRSSLADAGSTEDEPGVHFPNKQKMLLSWLTGDEEDGAVDYSVDVDQAALGKLPSLCRISLETGVKVHSTDSCRQFRILQVIRAQSSPRRRVGFAVVPSDGEKSCAGRQTKYYVWTRWRQGGESRSQGALSGPYEYRDLAHRRYERLLATESSGLQKQATPSASPSETVAAHAARRVSALSA